MTRFLLFPLGQLSNAQWWPAKLTRRALTLVLVSGQRPRDFLRFVSVALSVLFVFVMSVFVNLLFFIAF